MMKKVMRLLVIVVIIIMSFSILFATGCCNFGGDGSSSCKNCGSSSIYALGFCRRCYNSFHDYTYGDQFSKINIAE